MTRPRGPGQAAPRVSKRNDRLRPLSAVRTSVASRDDDTLDASPNAASSATTNASPHAHPPTTNAAVSTSAPSPRCSSSPASPAPRPRRSAASRSPPAPTASKSTTSSTLSRTSGPDGSADLEARDSTADTTSVATIRMNRAQRAVGRRGRIASAVLALAWLSACGSDAPRAASPAPAQHEHEVAPTRADRAALKHVVAEFDKRHDRGDTEGVCELMTALTRRYLAEFVASAVPRLAGRSCAAMLASDVFANPGDLPPAVRHAARFKFRRIAVDTTRATATITFPDCGRWRLVRRGTTWVITDIPILPPSLRTMRRSCTQ